MSEKEEYFTELKDGELAVRTLSQSGSIVPEEGKDPKKYVTALVETSNGKQLCLKTLDMNGGGGGGGEQNIKAYHAPSATLDATLGVIIPNVDACTEQGLYNVDYSFESDGATITSNALLEVSETSMSGVSAIAQNLLINVGTELVYCTRNYISNTFTSWSGKNIPAELMKCLQNKATGQDSVSLLDDTTNSISVLIGKKNANNTPSYGAVCIGHLVAGAAQNSIAIGRKAKVANTNGVAVGFGATAYGQYSLALGSCATSTQDPNYTPASNAVPYANGAYSIQLGIGQNNYQKTLQVYEYQLLDGNTGKIPNERISAPIVIEKADDGNGNGYRLWSDGWLEQYGVYDNQAKSNDFYTTVNFTKTFANAFYFSTAQAFNLNETEAFRDGSTDIYAKTTSSISFGFYRSGSGDGYRYISWKCEGYIQTES